MIDNYIICCDKDEDVEKEIIIMALLYWILTGLKIEWT